MLLKKAEVNFKETDHDSQDNRTGDLPHQEAMVSFEVCCLRTLGDIYRGPSRCWGAGQTVEKANSPRIRVIRRL